MDLVRELRLRQWARQHYVPAEERQCGWHPVVLDEMGLKDQELLIQPVAAEIREVIGEPTIDATPIVGEPASEKLVALPVIQDDAAIEFAQHPWGWTFVPLSIDKNLEVHAGSSNIPRPHARKFWGNIPQCDDASYLFVMD